MAKLIDTPTIADSIAKSDSFEIIELAIDEVDLLTKAFGVIAEVCAEMNNPSVYLDSAEKKYVIN